MQQGRGQAGRKGASNYDAPVYSSLYTSSPDLDTFCELTQSGGFYEFLMVNLRNRSCPVFTRDDVKERLMADVLAKRGNYPSAVEDMFREHFPTVYRFICGINKDGAEHANLIRLLQRAESDLVIHTVVADLAVRRPEMFILTLHDSIYTTARDIPEVVEAFEAAFNRNCFAMTLKLG